MRTKPRMIEENPAAARRISPGISRRRRNAMATSRIPVTVAQSANEIDEERRPHPRPREGGQPYGDPSEPFEGKHPNMLVSPPSRTSRDSENAVGDRVCTKQKRGRDQRHARPNERE